MPYPYLVGPRQIDGKLVWFEHASNDMQAARAFYESLFGWDTELVGTSHGGYPVIKCGEAGFGGYRTPMAGEPVHWSGYLSVEDVDKSLAAVLTSGASLILGAKDLGKVGRAAAILDPAGAPLYLWHGKLGDPDDRSETPVGWWHGGLYLARDAASLAFYERHFGWTTSRIAGTDYSVLRKNGVLRALAMPAPESITHSLWAPIVAVADAGEALDRAVSLGARVLQSARPIAGIGTIAIATDPFGAVVAFFAR